MEVVRSVLPRGRVTGIDTSAALARNGVVAVLTATDLPRIPVIPIRVGATSALEGRLQPVLASETVNYVGEPIGVVIADTAAIARDAADDVRVDIQPLPALASAVQFESAPGTNVRDNVLVDIESSIGDLDAAFADAALTVGMELSTARRTGAPIEPRGLIAAWAGDELHLWGVTKFVHFTRRSVAGFFDIDPSLVLCHRVDVGGMFGVRGELYPEDFLVPWAALKTGKPVRWNEQRRPHFLTINHAGEQIHQIRIAMAASGELVALDADVLLDAGAYPRPIGSRIPHIINESLPGPYRWRALHVRCRSVFTNKTPGGTVRGPATFETTFARERMIDVAARRAGLDPLRVRVSSLLRPIDLPYQLPTGNEGQDLVLAGGDYPDLVASLLSRSRYEWMLRERDRRRAAGELVGLGFGFFVIHSALGGNETVGMDLTSEGRFVLKTSATDVGQGLDRMARQLLSDRLGVPQSSIDVWSGDSSAHSEGNGTFSSRSTVFVGNATIDAIGRLTEETASRAAALLGCSPEQVVHGEDGPTSAFGNLFWKEVAPVSVIGAFEMSRPTYGFGAHLAMVSVDRDTGEVRLEKLAVGYDCGKALDRAMVVDQIVGAAVMGIGGALHERLAFDPDGIAISATFADYLIPRAVDVPPILVMIVESAAPENPLGVRGVGEAGTIAVGAATANAVADALGIGGDRITSLPVRPEDVITALIRGGAA
jgi:CO/xanthine dehydrogenase Mo-binding subunit